MKSLEYVVHGTSSERDAEQIKEQGFKLQEGRATVSGNLIYAFEWATEQDRREGSKSQSEIEEGEKGRVIIMRVPENEFVDYAIHTDIEIDENLKEITGYSSKYESGRKQLAIYNEGDTVEKKKKIELAKKELKEINKEILDILEDNNIDSSQVKSREDLIKAIKDFNLEKKVGILKRIEDLEKQKMEKMREAEPDVEISQENILMSILPTKELGEKLDELSKKIRNLEYVDLEDFTEEISKIIEDNKDNFLMSGLDVREVVENILSSTMEAEVINIIRSFFMNIKRVQGYDVYNRGKDEKKDKEVDRDQLKQKLERILSVVESDNFDIGTESLNRYIKMNIKKLLVELG